MQDNMLDLEQRQVLSANQVQSLEILAYTNQELEAFLLNEYLQNPMLDNTLDKQNDMIKDLEHIYERGVSYKDQYILQEEDDNSRRNDIKAMTPDELKDSLLNQMNRNIYNDTEWKLMGYLIQCLDDKGFFTYEVSYIANLLGYDEKIVNKCLNILKDLDPVGIFSKDISECLIKQLLNKEIDDKMLFTIVEQYIPDILEGRIGVVSRSLKLPTAKIREYIQLIGTLNPRPIMNAKTEQAQYLVPDILVELDKGQWQIQINDQWMGEYKYNDYYIRMMKESQDESLKQYFKEKLERARFILSCVEQRRSTIIKIVKIILQLQEDYFINGKALRPMSMEDVAILTGMHVSTVSRAIRDKYLQFKKVVLIKDLFITAAASKDDISVDDIKRRIQELVREEISTEPLSDQKIVEQLRAEGIEMSRRTIAKYRKELGIPDSRQRLYL